MTTTQATIKALIQTKAKIKDYQVMINGLRKQEKELVKEITFECKRAGCVDDHVHHAWRATRRRLIKTTCN